MTLSLVDVRASPRAIKAQNNPGSRVRGPRQLAMRFLADFVPISGEATIF